MTDLSHSQLGKETTYLDQYDPNVLIGINRDDNRKKLGIDVQDLPFQGMDIWNGYDFTWLNTKNYPEFGMLSIFVPCNSPNLIEAKSLKLYLMSYANSQFQSINEIIANIEQDLANIAGSKIKVNLANILMDFMHIDAKFSGTSLDTLNPRCNDKTVNSQLLKCDPKQTVNEELCSDLFKFNCMLTNKPNCGSIRIAYNGPQVDPESLLQYLISYRNTQNLHEECIEQIYMDILTLCQPDTLLVEGRFTRRGGLDINPLRAKQAYTQQNRRLFRQ